MTMHSTLYDDNKSEFYFFKKCSQAINEYDVNIILKEIINISPISSLSIFSVIVNADNKIISGEKIISYGNDEFWNKYVANSFIKNDPVIEFSVLYAKPTKWADNYSQYRNREKSMAVINLIESESDISINDSVSLAFSSQKHPHIFTIFSLVYTDITLNVNVISKLNILLPHAHNAILEIYPVMVDLSKRKLSKREEGVISLISEGKTSKEISNILHISVRTVKFHLGNIYGKLNVKNRTQATSMVLKYGLIHK